MRPAEISIGPGRDQQPTQDWTENPVMKSGLDHNLVSSAFSDATDRKIISDAVSREKELARITLASIGDAVLCTDASGKITYLNAVAEKMTGWCIDDARALPHNEVFTIVDGETHRPIVNNPIILAIKHNKIFRLPKNSMLVRRDGFECAIEDSAAPIHDLEGGIVGAVVVFHDTSAAVATERRLAHRAQHDFLTDLPNPVLLNDRISQAISLARRNEKEAAVLFLDLDHFKEVNDSLGHAVGDQLLQSVARRLKGSVRESDTVGRKGGDEFVVLLSEITNVDDAARSAEKICAAVVEMHLVSGHELRVTASIGISIYPRDGLDAADLLKSADQAMYQAKKSGRNQFSFSPRVVETDAAAIT